MIWLIAGKDVEQLTEVKRSFRSTTVILKFRQT